ncbi:Glycine N-methyltransferase [Eumeta japonica]|uniref:Glycine N-methyltransferase n=1 Tax=Eumeta variegata TaxID=151549 RepID=A0A4C1SMV6_EUMVA|nr:Glycine N-methyltransferase [Eumeta japonica]
MAADKTLVNRSAVIPSEGLKDQYADRKFASIWTKFVGDGNERIGKYKDFLIGLLKMHNCVTILDAACGTGIDSMMLVDEGFKVVSVDASDQMLKHALKARWEKRKDPKYDEWGTYGDHRVQSKCMS